MSQLSDKELLEVMSNFRKHELPTRKRAEMLQTLSEASKSKPREPFNFQRVAAMAAVFILVLIAPILYFSSSQENSATRPGEKLDAIKPAERGTVFALKDDNGNPIFADSNFGIPNKVSLLAPTEWIAKDTRSVGKMMIYLWGNYEKDFANKPLKVEAVHVKTGVKEHLATTVISGGMYGSDAHALTSFEPFTLPGVYNLEFFAGDEKVGEFSIYVKEPYVKIGNATLLVSQEDLYAGLYEDAVMEVEGDNLPPEMELELFQLETAEVTTFTFKDKTEYTRTDGKRISLYTGDFQLKKSGKYRISVLKQSEAIEVRKPISN
ncbi:hypothetical protein QE429_001490 [Bacillus sp. SORGH_AS 510]|uniref:hypothetical protein n=1 Tax=Bacillus sp. SORGH_AS_0510 TaxID=3041771 RepID=UPI00277F448D|nr:hypothetical protein [Bacillus sp. SORGH_AS_0510]MDQ1144663.1 hypothetical protein [Bacillus sp. SORGH_AS_0510]